MIILIIIILMLTVIHIMNVIRNQYVYILGKEAVCSYIKALNDIIEEVKTSFVYLSLLF